MSESMAGNVEGHGRGGGGGASAHAHGAVEHGHDEHEHASPGFYWLIGGILAVLTAIEVAAYYMELGRVEVPLLLILSAAKFALVVMFFMHLKFDSKVFTGVFIAGLSLAAFMVTALVALYHWLPVFGT